MFDLSFTCENTPTGEGTVSIETETPSAIVAPAQVWLRAVDHDGLASFEQTGAVYDGAHHEYYHEWTINGSPLSAWSKPQSLISEHNNPNKMFGREVAFLLPTAGDYVIDLVVTDRLGNTATASTSTITVQDPEDYFPEADRIYVDPDGVWAGVPAASTKYTTLIELEAALTSFGTNPTWLCLRNGVEHSMSGVAPGGNDNGREKIFFQHTNTIVRISGYGSGPGGSKPIITAGTDSTRDARNSLFDVKQPKNSIGWRTVTGLRFESNYNPETWHGIGNCGAALSMSEWKGDEGFCLFHDIETEGTGYGFSAGNSIGVVTVPVRFMIADCEVDGWRDYGHFGCSPNTRFAFIGNYFHQKPNTPNHGDQDGTATNHGPIRIPYGFHVVVQMNDLYSRGGWDGNDQACLRLFPSADQTPTQVAHVSRNTFIGGWEIIHMRRSSDGEAVPVNVVIEKCLTVGTGKTSLHLYCQRSGVTVRDNIAVDLNAPRDVPTWGGAAYLFTADSKVVAGNEADPICIYGNTYLSLFDASNDGVNKTYKIAENLNDYFTNMDDNVENNVVHKPSGDITATDFAPINIATNFSGVDATYNGTKKGFEALDIVMSSEIVNGATYPIAYVDTNQDLRDGTSLGGATDQAYWQAIEATDTDHQLYIFDDTASAKRYRHYSQLGDFSVDFSDATNIVITNTSGMSWPINQRIAFRLDRKSLTPAIDATYANGADVPIPRPTTGSPAIGGATTGRISPTDFFLESRGATPDAGAVNSA